ncbi:MAG: NAD(P)/FAD-dependent oxidoreductase [Geobacter sp.]|nr:MAG: NAD(P)/FAD-dependent oxidoreductase [Geobacter sp.]
MKHNIPEKGAVIQRDGETYAVKVHMPGGFTTPEALRMVADVAERYGIPSVKITIAQRIALIGIPEDKIDAVRSDLGDLEDGATGLCIRYVKMCPGATWCKRGQQVTHDIGMEMDRKYHRLQVPWKFKMAVSGCINDCTEVCIRDLGLIGTPKGWNIMLGGNGGSRPRFAVCLLENIPSEDAALAVVEKVVDWFKSLERKCRIGKVVEEMGIDAIRAEIFGK